MPRERRRWPHAKPPPCSSPQHLRLQQVDNCAARDEGDSVSGPARPGKSGFPVEKRVRQEKMEHGKILKVAVLKDGRLGIFPDRPDPAYQYIYREAAGVYWNQELGCFQSTVPREWDYPKWDY